MNKSATNVVKTGNWFKNSVAPEYIEYLSAAYNGMLYVIIGVLFSYFCNTFFVWLDKKYHTVLDGNEPVEKDDIPTWRIGIEFGFQTLIIIIGVILIKEYVPKIPSPLRNWRLMLNVDRDVTTGTVLLAFSVLMYMDEYKAKLKLFISRIVKIFGFEE